VIRDGRVQYHDALGALMVDIDSVQQAPYNYNNGDVDVIAESIHMNGMYRPIYVQAETGHIIAGNHTWLACKELGAAQVPVVPLEVDDIVAQRIMIEDNEAAKRAISDRGQLLTLLDRIHDATGMYLASVTDRDVEIMKALEEIPLQSPDFAQWPTFSVQVHPNVLAAFMSMTREADTDAERFELMIRLAGWEG
jgi:hypothetical protein